LTTTTKVYVLKKKDTIHSVHLDKTKAHLQGLEDLKMMQKLPEAHRTSVEDYAVEAFHLSPIEQ